MSDQRPFSLGVAILAAGASSRMGRPKMLLPWGETTVLGHLIGVWRRLGAGQIAVVRAPGASETASELRRLQFSPGDEVINPDPDRGMFSSIQVAAQWKEWSWGLSHYAILLGDQPHLLEQTLATLMDFAADNFDNVCQPSRQGRARHPVIFPKPIFKDLANSKVETLSQFLRSPSCDRRLVEIDDPGLDFDLDYPADYDRARAMVFGR